MQAGKKASSASFFLPVNGYPMRLSVPFPILLLCLTFTFLQTGYAHPCDSLDWDALDLALKKVLRTDFWETLQEYPAREQGYVALDALEENQGTCVPLKEALAFHKIGVEWHIKNDFHRAVAFYKRALAIRTTSLSEADEVLIKSNMNIGQAYIKRAKLEKRAYLDSARVYLTQAVQLSLGHPEPPAILGDVYRELSQVYNIQGDYANAVHYLMAGKRVYEQFLGHPYKGDSMHYSVRLAITLNNLSGILSRDLNQPEEALACSRQALNIYFQLGVSARNQHLLAEAQFNYALTLNRAGRSLAALAAYQRNFAMLDSLALNDAELKSKVYNNLSVVYHNLGHFDQAMSQAQASIRSNPRAERSSLGNNYDNLGAAHLGLKNYEKAIAAFDTAISYYTLGPVNAFGGRLTPETIILDQRGLLESMSGKGEALFQQGKAAHALPAVVAAHQIFRQTDSLLDVFRNAFLVEDSKSSLWEYAKPIYEQAIAVALFLHAEDPAGAYAEKAFQYSEKSKALLLLEALSGRDPVWETLPMALKDSLEEVSDSRRYYEQELGYAELVKDSDSTILALRNQVSFYRVKEEQWMTQAWKHLRSPLAGQEWEELSIDQVRKHLLEPGQNLIEYFVGEESVYLFVISADSYQVITLPGPLSLNQKIPALRKALVAYHTGDNPERKPLTDFVAEYHDLARELYRQLIVPIEGLSPRTIIVPDGILGYLPFEALIAEDAADRQDYTQFSYMMDESSISYAFSAAVLAMFKRNAGASDGRVAAFAPVDFSFLNEKLDPDFKRSLGTEGFAPLLASDNEIKHLLEKAPGKSYLRDQASLAQVKEGVSRAGILHFSTHALMNEKDGRFSVIAMYDTLVSLIQIYNEWTIHAQLVVLGACETHIGQIMQGEGIASLSRAFAAAGAKSMVSTLWAVDNATTLDVMPLFYENLEGTPKDVALTRTKQHLKRNFHPYYWAGYVAIGDMRPLVRNASWGPLQMVILALGMIGLVGGVFWVALPSWRNRTHRILVNQEPVKA